MGIFVDALSHFADDVWDNRSRIMTFLSCIGTGSTFIFTIRANNKANERRHEAQAEKGEYLTTWERFSAESPAYILPGGICILTIMIQILCQIDHEHTVEKLSVALATLSKIHYDRIRAEKEAGVEENVSAELVDKVEVSSLPEGTKIYKLGDRVFYAAPEDIYRGLYALNRHFRYNHCATVSVFVKAVNSDTLQVTELDHLEGWATWHVPHDSICSPQFIQLLAYDRDNGKNKWTELEWDFDPETSYDGY